MQYLAAIPSLAAIEELLAEVTDAQIERAGTKMPERESTDKEIGVVGNPLTRRIYTLLGQLRSKVQIEHARSTNADTEEDEARHIAESHRAYYMAEVVSDLFWLEAHAECNTWKASNVGLRKGWILVESIDKKKLFMQKMGIELPE